LYNRVSKGRVLSENKVQKDFHGEPFPVHETLNVIDGRTLKKGDKYWQAVVLYDTQFRKKKTLAVYLWTKDESKPSGWRRQQKMQIRANNWEYLKKSVEELLPKLAE
jgi:hypothetical protein